MFTDEWQMFYLEKSEHASVAAKMVLFLSSEKRNCQVQKKIPGVEAQDRGVGELHFHCFGSRAFSGT